MDRHYILAVDEGTTSCTALVIGPDGRVCARATREVNQVFPGPGMVEQDPEELYRSTLAVLEEARLKCGLEYAQIRALGITNQRETTLVWERESGRPVYNAVVWQCRRSAAICEDLKARGLNPLILAKTGLVVDAYFSGTKLRWILDHIPDGQRRAENGELLFGTVDSWLVWKLTGGRLHITDCSNAARTLLFNIHTLKWDPELLRILNIPPVMLPQVEPSSRIYGETQPGILGEGSVPIGSLIGDQQASLFGQACLESGAAKNTYGTGSFLLFNTGPQAALSQKGLVTTIGWAFPERVTYALEGSIFVTGAAVQWLRDGLQIISSVEESEALALAVPDNGGVYFVPAFTGLGAPVWDMYARGTLLGLTRGSTRGHIARAALEAIAFQVRDVVDTMQAESGLKVPGLKVDGGGTSNRFLMQFQADILNLPIQVSDVADATALGAGYLAGLAAGLWQDPSDLAPLWRAARTFEPVLSADRRDHLYRRWQKAVEHARGWAQGE